MTGARTAAAIPCMFDNHCRTCWSTTAIHRARAPDSTGCPDPPADQVSSRPTATHRVVSGVPLTASIAHASLRLRIAPKFSPSGPIRGFVGTARTDSSIINLLKKCASAGVNGSTSSTSRSTGGGSQDRCWGPSGAHTPHSLAAAMGDLVAAERARPLPPEVRREHRAQSSGPRLFGKQVWALNTTSLRCIAPDRQWFVRGGPRL